MTKPMLPIRALGVEPYLPIFEAMRAFTKTRGKQEDDQIWLVEHEPVFTQGLAGKPEHVLAPGDIPIVKTDRGGQVTYHGPGQAVVYLLLDVKDSNYGVRPLVSMIENSVIDTLADFGITAHARADAPGVYVENGRKIASLGLKISRGCSYHGVAINVDMDLEPFSRINPCGLIGMHMAQVSEFTPNATVAEVSQAFATHFSSRWFQHYGEKSVKGS